MCQALHCHCHFHCLVMKLHCTATALHCTARAFTAKKWKNLTHVSREILNFCPRLAVAHGGIDQFDLVLSSPLQRCLQTLAISLENRRHKVQDSFYFLKKRKKNKWKESTLALAISVW